MKHITYAYDRTPVLNDVSMTFEDGACYAIVGPSGAGKTTLLSLMSGLTAIQDGDILYQGKSLRQMNMYDYRSHDAGIIFQHYNLLTKLTALENVELSMEISGMYRRGRRERARALLAYFKKVENIASAEPEEIMKVEGFGADVAKKVYEYFRREDSDA